MPRLATIRRVPPQQIGIAVAVEVAGNPFAYRRYVGPAAAVRTDPHTDRGAGERHGELVHRRSAVFERQNAAAVMRAVPADPGEIDLSPGWKLATVPPNTAAGSTTSRSLPPPKATAVPLAPMMVPALVTVLFAEFSRLTPIPLVPSA